MAKTGRDKDAGDSGMDRVRSELGNYLSAKVGNLAEKAGGKLTDVTQQLAEGGESGGMLKMGSRLLKGENPAKAFIAEKAKGVKDNVVGKAKEALGGGGGKGRKSGDTKVTNIIEVLDIGLPLRTVYDHWTRYDKFSGFTKGVRDVSQSDEVTSDWKAKVGPSTRGWKATVQEQVPDERIIWTSEGAKGTTRGVVSFHELTPGLTRVVLVVEYYASGFFEKTGNIWRAQGRRLRLDFKHFQRYVTLTDEEPEGWRGEIRDGEVVRTHEEAVEEEDAEKEEEEGEEGAEEDEDGEYEDEDEAEDGEAEDEYDEDEEAEDGEEDEDEYPEEDEDGDGEEADEERDDEEEE
ncbi:SRPBCC family protein [Streptomyces sp. NPDC048248]|uniref:SRPBCC family protein n=1 Tax=Streptomyces sp. NPDC048248 TaxID=3365523 RepID=UPI003712EFB8